MECYWAVVRDEGLSTCCSVGEPGNVTSARSQLRKAVYSTVPFI